MSNATVGAALDRLRLEGAIFLRCEYTEAWAYESPTGEMMAGLLRPGRDSLLYFHIIASGRCWVSIDDGERHWADAGDVVVLPFLAAAANVSRSLLDERFRQLLGRSPIRYLTDWRLHVAKELLATTDLGVFAVARRVGYDAEEAFSRAFKRAYGMAPARWRAGQTA